MVIDPTCDVGSSASFVSMVLNASITLSTTIAIPIESCPILDPEALSSSDIKMKTMAAFAAAPFVKSVGVTSNRNAQLESETIPAPKSYCIESFVVSVSVVNKIACWSRSTYIIVSSFVSQLLPHSLESGIVSKNSMLSIVPSKV